MNTKQMLIMLALVFSVGLLGFFLISLFFPQHQITNHPETPIAAIPSGQSITVSDKEIAPQIETTPTIDNTIDYARADIHALNAPASAEANLKNLAEYLGSVSSNDFEKARAIFKWITDNIEYDVASLEPGARRIVSPREVLRRRRCVCGGYSSLFRDLAMKAGLECEEIFGYLKGASYIPGDPVDVDVNHSWNAVKIDDKWHLVDVTLGGGFLDENGNYISKFNDFFFLTEPQNLIFTHLPQEQKWQLLANPINKKQFSQLVQVSSRYFEYGLQVENHYEGDIRTSKPIEIKTKCPANISLTSSISTISGDLIEHFSFTQTSDGIAITQVSLPGDGDYILTIFGKLKDSNIPAELDSFGSAIQYRIRGRNFTSDLSFPEMFGSFTKREAYLYGPFNGTFNSGQTVSFRIRVPNARKVAVVQGDNWHILNEHGDIYRDDIRIEGHDFVNLMAQFAEDAPFEGLLRYRIKPRIL